MISIIKSGTLKVILKQTIFSHSFIIRGIVRCLIKNDHGVPHKRMRTVAEEVKNKC